VPNEAQLIAPEELPLKETPRKTEELFSKKAKAAPSTNAQPTSDELSALAWSKLSEIQRADLRRKTCRAASKKFEFWAGQTFCPACRCDTGQKRKRCSLKSGEWPVDFVSTPKPRAYSSPEKRATAALDCTEGERDRRGTSGSFQFGTPTGFRDQTSADYEIWRTRHRRDGRVTGDSHQLADGMTVGDYRVFGDALGVLPSTVEVLVKLALAASHSQGIELSGDEVLALCGVINLSAGALRASSLEAVVPDAEDGDAATGDERPMTLTELCRATLPSDEFCKISTALSKSGDSIGLKDASVSDMHYDRKRHLSRIAAALVRQILLVAKAGTADPQGVWKLVCGDRSIKALDEDAAELSRDEILEQSLARTIAASYRIAARTKDRRLQKQLLSLLVVQSGLNYEDIINICSDDHDLGVGVDVRVMILGGKGRQYRLAKIIAVHLSEETAETLFTVEYYDASDAYIKARHATLAQTAEAFAEATQEYGDARRSSREAGVERGRIKVIGAVYCSRDQIWKVSPLIIRV
jgi:hypothetical protein